MKPLLPPLGLLALLTGPASWAQALDLEWVTVGAPGNPPDTDVMECCFSGTGTSGYGSVDYVYRIGRFELTVEEYAEFLNAVAAISDPYGLYHTNMAGRGIGRSGSEGSFVYQVTPGFERLPARNVDFYDAARLANWLHNGQPVGVQDATTTEDGAYSLLGANPLGVARNPEALFSVASEDEWYKAAYYNGATGRYFDFPTRSNVPPQAGPPPGGANSANVRNPLETIPECGSINSVCEPTEVGAYVFAVSPWGTFDQAGNLFEWMEDLTPEGWQVVRGGWFQLTSQDAETVVRTATAGSCEGCGGIGVRLTTITLPPPACDDGLDNDGDGWVDFPADPGCQSDTSTLENPACQDGLDNDGDGNIDFDGGLSAGVDPPAEADTYCNVPWKQSEKSLARTCGVGFELGFVLVSLSLWRRCRAGSRGRGAAAS